MRRSDLITHLSIAVLVFLVMIPSMRNHGSSMNLAIYAIGFLFNIVVPSVFYFFAGDRT